jgi:SAM-dependent methyltransferase
LEGTSFGALQETEVTREHVKSLVAGKIEEGYAANTVASIYIAVAAVFKDLKASKVVESSPCAGVQLPEHVESRVFVSPPLEQVDILASRIFGPWQIAVYLGYAGGLRIGESLAVRRDQIIETDEGAVLRINRDGGIPEDNPFADRDDAAPEIWSLGHRNPQSAVFDPVTQSLWIVEHGARGGDEVNRPEPGKNYGWPVISYGRHYSGAPIGVGTEAPGYEQPVFYWDPSIAPSGMAVYDGEMFPEWQGDFLIGALRAEFVSRLERDENGAVTGVDASAAMLAIASRKAGDRPNVRLLEGEATKLPVGDASVDRAISVQVFEYLSDVDAALAELMRVVRPGGRVVIWDIDWSTLSWHSSDAERMARMVAAWDRHLADPVLPRTLLASLHRAGFTDARRQAHAFTAESMDSEAFGGYMPALIRQYLGNLDDIDQAEADAWLADLKALDAGGAYSFAVLQFCFTATRPAIP